MKSDMHAVNQNAHDDIAGLLDENILADALQADPDSILPVLKSSA